MYIDLSEKHGHRNDHGFACGAEFNVKIRRRINIPDFVREKLSQSEIDEVWWEEAGRTRDSLKDALSRRYKWIGELAFVGRGPGWLAIEDTGCGTRNWDTISKVVDQYLKNFIKSMEAPRFWRDVAGVASSESSSAHHATMKTPKKKSPAQLQRDIDAALGRSDTSAPSLKWGPAVRGHGEVTARSGYRAFVQPSGSGKWHWEVKPVGYEMLDPKRSVGAGTTSSKAAAKAAAGRLLLAQLS